MKRTVLRMLREAAQNYPETAYTNQKGDQGWDPMTYPEVLKESRELASGLLQAGLQKGDKLALLAEGRNRWITSEFAMLFAGCTNVPLSIKLLPEEVLFRINHSDAKAVVLSRNTFEKVASVWKLLTRQVKIIFLEDDLKPVLKDCEEFGIHPEQDILLYRDLLKQGQEQFEANEAALTAIESGVSEDDIVTICYT